MSNTNSSRLYHKLFYTYTVVIVIIVVALVGYFISSTRSRILDSNLEYMELMSDRGIGYLEQCRTTASNINSELYQSSALTDDMFHYLRDDEEEYVRYRLDTYIASATARYVGVDGFAEKQLDAIPSIVKMDFISYERAEKTSFYPSGVSRRVDIRGILNSEEWQAGDMAQLEEDAYGSFSFHREIRDSVDRSSVGLFTVTFKTEKLLEIAQASNLPEMFLLDANGKLLFDSSLESGKSIQIVADPNTVENTWYARETAGNFILYTYLEKEAAGQVPLSALLAILLIGAGLIFAGEMCVHLYLRRLTKRLSYILNGMENVTTGNLSVRLKAEEGGDELDVISSKFNEMCEELDRYIQKSYLAEIEQKNAEMEVLQSQINPHFLYNTLEAIRMKAICNGDREVGKMLYSMAVIFRSQLKDADVIPLIQEIHYCKKYLELFEYRYRGKFDFEVDCAEELMQFPVIKFIIQPVLENYFIHGIQPEQEGNHISISVQQVDHDLWIHVIDNGSGMEQDQIEAKNEELRQKNDKEKKSIGLKNVNRRLQAVYGAEYGITLMQSTQGGLHVILALGTTISNKGEKENEKKSDVS